MFSAARPSFQFARGLAPFLLATLAQAQEVTITCDRTPVQAGVACTLTASASGNVDREWDWSVLGLAQPGRLLERIGPAQARFNALAEGLYTVQAVDRKDPQVKGTLALWVAANLDAKAGTPGLGSGAGELPAAKGAAVALESKADSKGEWTQAGKTLQSSAPTLAAERRTELVAGIVNALIELTSDEDKTRLDKPLALTLFPGRNPALTIQELVDGSTDDALEAMKAHLAGSEAAVPDYELVAVPVKAEG